MFKKKVKGNPVTTAKIELKSIIESVSFLNRKQHDMNQEDTQAMNDMSAIEKAADELQAESHTIMDNVNQFNERFSDILRVNTELQQARCLCLSTRFPA